MKISYQELKERLNWTLEQKIDHSLMTIENALTYSDGNAFVSDSGGLDSTVLRYLCRIVKPNIKSVFFNTTNEFPEIYRFIKSIDNLEIVQPPMNLKSVIEKVGFPLVSKEQAQYIREYRHSKSEKQKYLRLHGRPNKPYQGKISAKWQFLINAPFEISEKCCIILKKNPSKIYERKNRMFPIIGTLTGESTLRQQKYLKQGCNAFEAKRPASYPLSIWTRENEWEFIKQNKIPYCEIYDKGETQTGCMFCGFGCHKEPERFERLEKTQPKAFETGMNLTNNGYTYRDAIKYTLKQ